MAVELMSGSRHHRERRPAGARPPSRYSEDSSTVVDEAFIDDSSIAPARNCDLTDPVRLAGSIDPPADGFIERMIRSTAMGEHSEFFQPGDGSVHRLLPVEVGPEADRRWIFILAHDDVLSVVLGEGKVALALGEETQ